MKTLNANYQRNIDIMKENLRRGLDIERANSVVNSMEKQFIQANLYDDDAKHFIQEMKATILSHFTKVNITVVK